jgi:replicative DNA helicase
VSAQEQVLGAVLVNPSLAAEVLDRLGVDDFEPGWQQLVYTAIDELWDADKPADADTILAHLMGKGLVRDAGFGVWLAELYENAPYSAAMPIESVLEKSYRRNVLTCITRIRQAIDEWPLEALKATVDREFSAAMLAAARLEPPVETKHAPTGLAGLTAILGGVA